MRKKNLSKLDVYYPMLFKLEDDRAIIHSTLLHHIRKQLANTTFNGINIFTPMKENHEFDFQISSDCFTDFLQKDPTIKSIDGYVFYYHHRLIFFTHIEYNTIEPAFRTIRMNILQMFQDITATIIPLINTCILESKTHFLEDPDYLDITSNLPKIQIKSFYSYCLVFQPKNNSFLKKNNQIQTFNIRTLQPKLIPIGRTSLLRMSIPNMTAYYNGKLSTEFKSELVNTVYKIVLYPKKIKELKQTDKFETFDYSKTKKHLVIDEELIMDMWQYCIDSFGGKRTDQLGNKGAIVGLIFSIFAVVLSIVSLIQSLV